MTISVYHYSIIFKYLYTVGLDSTQIRASSATFIFPSMKMA